MVHHDSTHSVLIVMEFCSGGSISDFATHAHQESPDESAKAQVVEEKTIAHMCSCVSRALAIMHGEGIIHRDIKGANVLVSTNGAVKIADFGAAGVKRPGGVFHDAVGTPAWMAPEVCACDLPDGHSYDERCDVWSLGILALELAEGKAPLFGEPGPTTIFAVPSNPPPTLKNEAVWSTRFKDFLLRALIKDYMLRPQIDELQHHPLFVGFNENDMRKSVQASPHFGHLSIAPTAARIAKVRPGSSGGVVSAAPGVVEGDDLAAGEELTESSILQRLNTRFDANSIYTYIGDVLLAINPFKAIGSYTEDMASLYTLDAKHCSRPHIYALALNALRSMRLDGKNQSCVVSGESGAGKTETTKYFLGHLLDLSRGEDPELLRKYDGLQFVTNMLLEAFGNAVTVANPNSSRFGKYVELQFDTACHVSAAKVSHYILEKSRVVRQGDRERNFHFFYYLLEGLDDRTLHALELVRDPGKYSYLNGGVTPGTIGTGMARPTVESGGQAAAMQYMLLSQQMQDVGFSQADLDGISSLIAVILHLGNIDFAEAEQADGHYFDLRITGPMDLLARLIGCQAGDLGNSLVTNIMVMRGETIVLKNTAVASRDARDAMAKALYSRMFSWIVNGANKLVGNGDPGLEWIGRSIGVLDIFGFEDVGVNSFEQLCINTANEQLHNFFNQRLFMWHKQELKGEGIASVSDVSFEDNIETLQLTFGTPVGLLALLDEETRFPGATDTSLIQKLHQNLHEHSRYTAPRYTGGADPRSMQFTISHFAGPITYTVVGWLEKNSDALSPSTTSILRGSSLPLVSELFSMSQTATGRLATGDVEEKLHNRKSNAKQLIRALRGSVWKKGAAQQSAATASTPSEPSSPTSPGAKASRRQSRRETKSTKRGSQRIDSLPNLTLSSTQRTVKATLALHFKASLLELMTKLGATTPQFVRCVRPNVEGVPHSFDNEAVLRQLRCTGVMETVRIRRNGFALRLPFAVFINTYKIVAFRLTEQPLVTRDSCVRILETCGLNSTEYAVGASKVMLKYTAKNKLLTALEKINAKGAAIINVFRVFIAKQAVVRRRKQKIADDALKKEQEQAHIAEETRRADEARIREAERLQKEKVVEEARLAELERARLAEEERQIAAEQARLLAEQRAQEQAMVEEANRRAELEAEEAAAQAAEQAAAQEATMAEEARARKQAQLLVAQEEKLRAETDVRAPLPLQDGAANDGAGGNDELGTAPAVPPRTASGSPLKRMQASGMSKAVLQGHVLEDRDVGRANRGADFFQTRLPANIGRLPTEDEFEELELYRADETAIPEGCVGLNRYRNVLPNPETRVILEPHPDMIGYDAAMYSYINANTIGGGASTDAKYIATQGPKGTTVDHFWRMVWQENTSLIVMVTECIEGMRIKCHQYWPEDMGEAYSIVTEPSEIEITMINSRSYGSNSIATLRLERAGVIRTIEHLQFLGWPDQGVPERLKDVLAVIEVMRQHRNANPMYPPIVHCSAGIGRTGVVIGIDIGIDMLKSTGTVNVEELLLQMRRDRGSMVQTHEQLELVYRCLARLAKAPQKLDAIINAEKGAAPSTLASHVFADLDDERAPASPSGVVSDSDTEFGFSDLEDADGTSEVDPSSRRSSGAYGFGEESPTPLSMENLANSPIDENGNPKSATLAAAIAKAENIAPPDFIHPSQVDVDFSEESHIPAWRLAQRAAKEAGKVEEFTEDLKYASPDRAKRRSSRFKSKRKSAEDARGVAEKLISTLEEMPDDDPAVLLTLADTGSPPKHFYPTEASGDDLVSVAPPPAPAPAPALTTELQASTNDLQSSNESQGNFGAALVAFGSDEEQPGEDRQGSPSSDAEEDHATVPKKRRLSIKGVKKAFSRLGGGSVKSGPKTASSPPSSASKRKGSSFFGGGSVKSKQASSSRRGSFLRRASKSSASSAESDDDSEADADLELDMAFFAELEANRAERSKEGEARRLKLIEEHKIEKAKQEAEEAKVVEKIEAQMAHEQEEEDKRRDELVSNANAKLEELTFSFTWG